MAASAAGYPGPVPGQVGVGRGRGEPPYEYELHRIHPHGRRDARGGPHSESFTEMEALGLFGGKHAARLLDTDRVLGAILMQHVQPGTMLWQLEDNQKETEIAASVMKSLTVSVPATHDLPAFSQWVERAFRLTRTTWDPDERMPRHLLERAEQAFAKIQQRPEAEGGSAWRSAS